MKTTFILKNTGDNPAAEVVVQVSYFVKLDESVRVETQEFAVPLKPDQEKVLEVDFGSLGVRKQEVLVLIQKPKGNIITQKSFLLNDIAEERERIDLIINKEINPETVPSTLIETSKPSFVYGRLLDMKGVQKMEDVQIIITVQKEDGGDFEPLTSVKTESQGYFSIDYPTGTFKQAAALIGLEVADNPIFIKLEEKKTKVTDVDSGETEQIVLVFPRRLLLVVDVKETVSSAEDDCNCGCSSGTFEEKRVLEEFSFYSLVRTSEPAIKGYVLEDEDEITLADVLGNLPFSVFELVEPLRALPFIARESPIKTTTRSTGNALRVARSRAVNTDDEFLETIKNVKIKKGVLTNFLKDEKTITKENIGKLFTLNEAFNFQTRVLGERPRPKPLGRVELDLTHTVDWDDEPTIYQAVEVAHGHLLQFKSEWIADGYSLGDLLYSLPLAPGQKKQIVVFDWERRESASNSQSVDYEESLYSSLARDRDVIEIAKGTVAENVSGSSRSSVGGVAGRAGGLIGGFLFGVSGGYSTASSRASQDSFRQISSSDQQKLSDKIVQSANAVRSVRSTVIQTVSQGERFEVSSESVANYNHCHALTIQYYEVLRHFKIRQRFAGARECLFVPLLMSQFDLKKALRWREPLLAGLLDKRLKKAFDAGDRVLHEWQASNFPSGTYASEPIITASGRLQLKFVLQRPGDEIIEVDDLDRPPVYAGSPYVQPVWHKKKIGKIIPANWEALLPFLDGVSPEDFYKNYLEDAANKDEVFHRMLGGVIARRFVDSLVFGVGDETGRSIGTIPVDASLTSRYARNGMLSVSLRLNGPTSFARERFHYLLITLNSSNSAVANILSEGSHVIVQTGFMRYRTQHYDGFLFNYQQLGDDLTATDGVTIYTGPSMDELKDPRKEDLVLVNKLIAHLNDNLELFHELTWRSLTDKKRFMLLDGIILNGKGEGRSVASLVQNELLAIVGNSLVFPVAPGLNLNPDFGMKESLTEFYMTASTDPVSVCVPTNGVFAEAVMGKCNSCETIDESRFWRWEESPIPDSPTAINPINTDTRRADPGNLQPQPLPTPVVNIQNAPNAPDPAGLAATLGVLGQSNLFKDITGLEGNQKNAMQAFQSSLDAAKSFAQEGAKLEVQKTMEKRLDKALNAINNDQSLSAGKKAELKEKALNAYMGGGATKEEETKDPGNAKFEEGVKMIDALEKSGVLTPEDAKEAKQKLNDNFLDNSSSGQPKSTNDEAQLMETASTNQVSYLSEKPNGEKLEIKPGQSSDFSGATFLDAPITLHAAYTKSEGYYQKVKIVGKRTGVDSNVITYELTNNTYDYLRVKALKIEDPNKVTFLDRSAYQKELLVQPGPGSTVTLLKVKVNQGEDLASAKLDVNTDLKIERGKGASATHALSIAYKLPYKTGEKYKVASAFNETPYHVGDEEHSIDFIMPMDQEIYAARGGIIVDIIRGFPENQPDPNNPGFFIRGADQEANNILIRHSDDTYGFYTHLKQNGIKSGLNVGDQVNAGDAIGKIGVTGNSAHPHLHFSVQNGNLQSIPWNFKDDSGTLYQLVKNNCYEAQKGQVAC